MGKIVRRTMEEYEPVIEWSADDAGSFEAAEKVFRDELEAGFTAVHSSDGRNEPVTELPQDADLIIITTAMGGG